jgi:hypothetical protein
VTITPKNILDDIWARLSRSSDAHTLTRIRNTLDESAFFSELDEYVRGPNNAGTKAQVLTTLVNIHRHCGDRSAERKNRLTNVRYGIGGGIALSGSSIIAIATLGPLAIIPLFAGGWIAFVCVANTGPISEQEQLYQDIATRTARVREKFDA